MVGFTLAQSLRNFIRALNEEGILDDNFNHLEMIRNQGNNPLFILDTLDAYLYDAEESIAILTRFMSEPVINYAQVKNAANHLKACSSGVGGCRVVQTCQGLVKACDDNDKDKSLESFERLNEEYGILQGNLCRICAIDRACLANEARRRHQAP